MRLKRGAIMDGRYEIMGVLGEGGFAILYEARQLNIDRQVAIKLLRVGLGEGEDTVVQQRFVREARATAMIDHPAVVTVYDFGLHGEEMVPYIVMERLHGHDLAEELIARGPMSQGRAVKLMCAALDALAMGHRQGIVHRDLKPSNLFLTHPGTPLEGIKLVDYGIAHLAEGVRLTLAGHVAGTPRYMAPESITRREISPAVDVYQMGLILAEMLTGQPLVPYTKPHRCFEAHTRGEVRVPEGLEGTPLGRALTRALAVDVRARYQDAAEFLAALREVDPDAIHSPVSLKPISGDRPPRPEDMATPRDADVASRPATAVVPAGKTLSKAPGSGPPSSEAPRSQQPAPVSEAAAPPVVPRPRRRWPVAQLLGLAVVLLGGGALTLALVGQSRWKPSQGDFVVIQGGKGSLPGPMTVLATEVTQSQWVSVMGENPSAFDECGLGCPVERVGFWDALTFCNALSELDGREPCYELEGCEGEPGRDLECEVARARKSCSGYRLPTGAEWRAMSKGDPKREGGWLKRESGGAPRLVRSLKPDALGLYGLQGNVHEWRWDSVGGKEPLRKVRRSDLHIYGGCSWRTPDDACDVVKGEEAPDGLRTPEIGLRVVLEGGFEAP